MQPVYLALAVLLCTCVRAQAQNDFQLFRPGVQYLYENPDYVIGDPYQIASQYYGVKVDSLGRQTLYSSLDVEINDFECIKAVPSPFGYSIRQTADSTVMYFGVSDSLVIYQRAETGTQWIARDSAGTVTVAEVLGQTLTDTSLLVTEEVKSIGFFGPDSATILGPPLIIGRQSGLISTPRLHRLESKSPLLKIVGISEPRVGLQLPQPSDYRAPEIGDEFHLQSLSVTSFSPDGPIYYENRFTTMQVVAPPASAANDFTVSYLADRLQYLVPFSGGGGPQDSTIVRDTLLTELLPVPPSEIVDVQPGASIALDTEGRYIALNNTFLGRCGLLSRRLTVAVLFEDTDSCGSTATIIDGGPDVVYTPYVPFYLDSISGLGGPYVNQLLYANTDSLVCGTPLSLQDIIIATRDEFTAFDGQLNVFPNPVARELTVKISGISVDYETSLYNLAGTRVQSLPLHGSDRAYFQVDDLASGTYMLVVTSKGRAVGRHMVIVQR